MERCQASIYWWDINAEMSCLWPAAHSGTVHWDGLRYFTDEGIQTPTDPPPWYEQPRSTS